MTAAQSIPASSIAINDRRKMIFRCMMAGVAGPPAIAFCPIVNNHFILWDDGVLVAQNHDFFPSTPSHWGHYWGQSRLYMPLTHMVWGVIAMVAQTPGANGAPPSPSPTIFHCFSLLLHAMNAILVFLLLRRMDTGDWAAYFGALLFAVH